MSSHLRHELIEISMPVIQWMLAKAASLSKVCSRRNRHGDFEKVKQKWSSIHGAACDGHNPVMILWYTDLVTLFEVCTGFSVAYAEARHMKRDTQLPCWLHILNFPHVYTSIYFNLHEIQNLRCKRILSVRPDIPSFAETGKIYICE